MRKFLALLSALALSVSCITVSTSAVPDGCAPERSYGPFTILPVFLSGRSGLSAPGADDGAFRLYELSGSGSLYVVSDRILDRDGDGALLCPASFPVSSGVNDNPIFVLACGNGFLDGGGCVVDGTSDLWISGPFVAPEVNGEVPVGLRPCLAVLDFRFSLDSVETPEGWRWEVEVVNTERYPSFVRYHDRGSLDLSTCIHSGGGSQGVLCRPLAPMRVTLLEGCRLSSDSSGGEGSVLLSGLRVLPQAVDDGTVAVLSLRTKLYRPGEDEPFLDYYSTEEFHLGVGSGHEVWRAGERVSYLFTYSPIGRRIVFAPSVEEWDSVSG